MSVREQATLDIQEELSKQGKCFLAFRVDLDPIMEKLVEEESKKQLIVSMV